MNQNKLFIQTRWRLAFWYAGVMGAILGVCGIGVYEAIAHAHRITIDREIKSVATTLDNSLKLILKQPGTIEPEVKNLLPNICSIPNCTDKTTSSDQTETIYQNNYYVRFLDLNQNLVALAGIEPKIPIKIDLNSWQHLEDNRGIRYHQISLVLETTDNRTWGYLQIGRSLQDFDRYVSNVGWILLLGLFLAMILVIFSAWWLAGLAMQPLYRSYQQIQQFTGDAAHELRTPLAAIRATIESILMLPTFEETEIKHSLQAIERQNNRLSVLVSDLLMLSRLDRELPSLDYSDRVNFNELIGDLIEEFSALALAAQINLSAKICVTQPIEINGNLEQLYRLVANLIINAIQSTSAGDSVLLVLDFDQNNNEIVLQVQDTGIGIATAEQKLIFNRFYRINSDRSRQSGGSGLGLAIAKAIVQTYQGNIEVQSKFGQGSTFIIRLPNRQNNQFLN